MKVVLWRIVDPVPFSWSLHKQINQLHIYNASSEIFTAVVRAQSMFCAHFWFKFVSFCLFVYFSLFYCIFWHYSWFVYAFSGVSQVFQGSYLHVTALSKGAFTLTRFIICISWFIMFIALCIFLFCVTCYLHLIFKSLSASVTRADHPASEENSMMSSHALP
jgi:hypothetical protein